MVLRNNGLYPRTLIGVFGKITYERTALKPADPESAKRLMELESTKSIYPLDCLLGVDKLPFKITCEMMCIIAKEAVIAQSYQKASERILQTYHVDISAVQVEKVTDFVGACVLEENRKLAEEAKKLSQVRPDSRKRRRKQDDIVYFEIDGAYVHVRDKVVKGSTGSDGQDSKKVIDAWTESKHAVTFYSRDIKYYNNKNGEPSHRILAKEFIGYIGPVSEFKYHFLALAKRHQYDLCTEVVVISDGAAWIHNMIDEFFQKYIHIIDLFHVKETIGKFATTVIRGEKGKLLADKVCDLVEGGEIDKALKLLEPYKDRNLPEGVPNAYTFITNNRGQMDYAFYKKMGYFVGSGAMESGNKQLLQNRMKLQGMRWLTESAQGMLALKSRYESNNWKSVYSLVRNKVYGTDYEYTFCYRLKHNLELQL